MNAKLDRLLHSRKKNQFQWPIELHNDWSAYAIHHESEKLKLDDAFLWSRKNAHFIYSEIIALQGKIQTIHYTKTERAEWIYCKANEKLFHAISSLDEWAL